MRVSLPIAMVPHLDPSLWKKPQSFVHISTLYCNCNRKFIKEQVYENEIGYEKIMQVGNAIFIYVYQMKS